MALQSTLFRGDSRLEAAATNDAAHVVPGDRGPHVAKIQTALNRLDRQTLVVDGIYGQQTADAVLAFKRKRNTINRSYQTTADNIVGKMTIAALDKELSEQPDLGPLEITVQGDKPRRNLVANPRQSTVLFGVGPKTGGPPVVVAPNPQFVTKFTRWSPKVTGTIRCAQTGGSAIAVCTNERDASLKTKNSVKSKIVFLSDQASPANQAAFPAPEDGGKVPLTNDPHVMRLETFRPGDATITVARPDVVRMLIIEVRQDKKGIVPGPQLTKLTANSKFFSASKEEGGEGIDPENIFSGRPVNVQKGGRLINLGGEGETPQFEDYQVDLDHSLGQHGGFRPWANDPDPSVFIPSQSASHITMRGTPLFDTFVQVIKRIAQPGCRFTYSGQEVVNDPDVGSNTAEKIISSQLPGKLLEPPLREPGGKSAFDLPAVSIAWEIS